jgi:hypothetical protein
MDSLGFGTTDLNGDGASFSDAYQETVIVFQEKAETMIVCHGVPFDLGVHKLRSLEIIN